jgi:hypothetical protein
MKTVRELCEQVKPENRKAVIEFLQSQRTFLAQRFGDNKNGSEMDLARMLTALKHSMEDVIEADEFLNSHI